MCKKRKWRRMWETTVVLREKTETGDIRKKYLLLDVGNPGG